MAVVYEAHVCIAAVSKDFEYHDTFTLVWEVQNTFLSKQVSNQSSTFTATRTCTRYALHATLFIFIFLFFIFYFFYE